MHDFMKHVSSLVAACLIYAVSGTAICVSAEFWRFDIFIRYLLQKQRDIKDTNSDFSSSNIYSSYSQNGTLNHQCSIVLLSEIVYFRDLCITSDCIIKFLMQNSMFSRVAFNCMRGTR